MKPHDVIATNFWIYQWHLALVRLHKILHHTLGEVQVYLFLIWVLPGRIMQSARLPVHERCFECCTPHPSTSSGISKNLPWRILTCSMAAVFRNRRLYIRVNPSETAEQALLHAFQVAWRSIAGKHYLLYALMQCWRCKKYILRFKRGHKQMNFVHDQHVYQLIEVDESFTSLFLVVNNTGLMIFRRLHTDRIC